MILTASFSGTVRQFTGAAAWIFVEVPHEILPPDISVGAWGFIAVHATVGSSTWKTSIMPMKDDKKFIALKKAIRDQEKISVGDIVEVKIEFA